MVKFKTPALLYYFMKITMFTTLVLGDKSFNTSENFDTPFYSLANKTSVQHARAGFYCSIVAYLFNKSSSDIQVSTDCLLDECRHIAIIHVFRRP